MKTLSFEFVEFIPEFPVEGIIYISFEYHTAVHKCACGCGHEVITPISPTDWRLIFNGESVSLDPSIGNWSFDCESHYWIIENKIEWARKWNNEEIEEGRENDAKLKKKFFKKRSKKGPK